MKSHFLILSSLLHAFTISAQLIITSGAQFSITGNGQVTLQNTDLVNDGSFIPGNSIFSFTGNAASFIRGSQPIQFNELEINKADNRSVLLKRAIGVSQRVLFTSGFLNLNGFNTDLGTTGYLDGEKENSRVTGPKGGQVLFTTSLNSPTAFNPANLGIFITSSQNLGNVTIKRGHTSQITSPGTDSGILRYYDILPARNTNLNATLRFEYFNEELNGLDENSIVLFKSKDTIHWMNLGFTSRSVSVNFVEKTGIGSFERFTLSKDNNQLIARNILFDSKHATDEIKLWPNPVHDFAFINIVTQNESQAIIRVFDSKGEMIKIQRATIFQGSNQISLDMKPLANGVYQISVNWSNGKMQKTLPVVKQ